MLCDTPATPARCGDGDEFGQCWAELQRPLGQCPEVSEVRPKHCGHAQSSEYRELLTKLENILRDHVADEESTRFPQLRARVPHEELVQIGHKVETAKKVGPTRPHRMAPNN